MLQYGQRSLIIWFHLFIRSHVSTPFWYATRVPLFPPTFPISKDRIIHFRVLEWDALCQQRHRNFDILQNPPILVLFENAISAKSTIYHRDYVKMIMIQVRIWKVMFVHRAVCLRVNKQTHAEDRLRYSTRYSKTLLPEGKCGTVLRQQRVLLILLQVHTYATYGRKSWRLFRLSNSAIFGKHCTSVRYSV